MSGKLHSLVSLSSRMLFDKSRTVLIEIASKREFSVTGSRRMRFVQYTAKSGGPQHLGAQITQDGDIFDISAVDSSIPNSLVKFLATDNGTLEKAKRSVVSSEYCLSGDNVRIGT